MMKESFPDGKDSTPVRPHRRIAFKLSTERHLKLHNTRARLMR